MSLTLDNIGIHFENQWVFRGVTADLKLNDRVVFLGDNGSGKSTLLRICSGFLSPEEGALSYTVSNKVVDTIAPYIVLSAPYIELIEEMTLQEFLEFHFSFKKSLLPNSDIIKIIGLAGKENILLENFSSGMKQRVSLAQAFFSETSILLLDEPCSNLDSKGFALYEELLKNYTANRITIIASNDPKEYVSCNKQIRMIDYK